MLLDIVLQCISLGLHQVYTDMIYFRWMAEMKIYVTYRQLTASLERASRLEQSCYCTANLCETITVRITG